MREIIFNPPARFHRRDASPSVLTQIPMCGLVLVVSIPAALLTAVIMGGIYAVRFVTKVF